MSQPHRNAPAPPARPGGAFAFNRRIRRALGGVLALLLLTAALAVYGVGHINTMTRSVVARHAADLYRAQQLRIHLQHMVAANRAYALTRDAGHAEAVRIADTKFRQVAVQLSRDRMSPTGRQALEDIRQLKQQHSAGVMQLMRSAPGPATRQVFSTQVLPVTEALERRLEDFEAHKRGRLQASESALARDARLMIGLLVAVMLASLVVGVAVWATVSHALRQALAYEQGLRESIATRDVFLAAVGHELRTPLSVLKLNVQLLTRRFAPGVPAPSAPTAQVLRMLERNVDVVVALIDRLLDVSLIDRGELKLRLGETDLSAMAREAAERAAPLFAGGSCTLEVDAPAPVVGQWDPVRIAQVLDNLIGNALRHGCDGPVTIVVRRDGDVGRISVRDHGPGLPEADRERIFDRFVSMGERLDGGGIGLGLAITREIVHAHGGSIRAGDAPGGGALFVVELPIGPQRP